MFLFRARQFGTTYGTEHYVKRTHQCARSQILTVLARKSSEKYRLAVSDVSEEHQRHSFQCKCRNCPESR
jgi:hypothetical protein